MERVLAWKYRNVHEQIVVSPRVRLRLGIHIGHTLDRVLLQNDPRVLEVWVFLNVGLVEIVDLALGRKVELPKASRARDARQAGLTERVIDSSLLSWGNRWVWDVTLAHKDRVQHIEGLDVLGCIFLRTSVCEGPEDDGLLEVSLRTEAVHPGKDKTHISDIGDLEVHAIVAELRRLGTVSVQLVHHVQQGLELVLSKEDILVVPGVGSPRPDLCGEACHDAKVVAGSSHGPEQILVLLFGSLHSRAIGENNVKLDESIADQAVHALGATMATSKSRT